MSFKLVPIVVPTGDAAPCNLVKIRGSFTRFGGLAAYLDVENGGVEYELRETSRGKQQWFRVDILPETC